MTRLLIHDVDTILWIVPVPGLHHLRQAVDPDAVPPIVLPPFEELPLADQRPYHYRRRLGRWHHPDRFLPLRTDGEELAPDGGGNMHSYHPVLLRPANSEHPYRCLDHRRTDSRSYAPATQ